ncbi:MAG: N-acetyltransferase [Eubacterium sp.]|nr:N-acetyltransferase [Eubacterium sp.]
MADNCFIADNVSLGENVIISDDCHISSGCVIGDNVFLGKGVYVDYNCIIRGNVSIGENSVIGADCILGEYTADWFSDHTKEMERLSIGSNSVIRSGSIIYSGSVIGDYFSTGHRVTIREKTVIGDHCSLGTLCDVQGRCSIGHYVRMHSNVHIGMASEIKNFVWIFPYTVLTNDPTPPSEILDGVLVENFAVIATSSTILPGVTIHSDSLVAAGATVGKDVEKGTIVGGTPSKVISSIDSVKNRITGEPIYPWRFHFDRGMPWEGRSYDEWYSSLDEEDLKRYNLE